MAWRFVRIRGKEAAMSKATEPDLRYIANRLPKTDDPYLPLFSKDEISRVRSFHRSFPQYAVTPLADLRHMAEYLGVARVAVKDESWRFGLNSFKVLGGSYAIGRFLAREMGMDISDLTYDTLVSDEFLEKLGSATFIAATDGNHGRGVAWTARELRQRCIVLMPKGTTQSRFDNIASLGAEVSIEDGNYDDCVRMAVEMAPSFEHGVIVQDTSWPGYTDIPTWIMQGYGVMADEAAEQFAEKPTHIFVQAGVGAMAGAVTGYFAALYPDDPPRVVVVEPDTADCMFRGAERGDGVSVTVTGDMPSIMAGLSCGEPCELGWDLFKNHATGFVSGADSFTVRGMRMLAGNFKDDPHVVSGESGAAGFGAFASIMLEEGLAPVREELGLGPDSKVLCFSTEGDTDPVRYKQIVWDGIDF
jgi:diaminopropionate ammonia-lyase